MEQYIDKAALVAEIEKLISKECKDYESYVALAERIATCINVLSILDTLEVKEVDLDKELKNLDDTLFDLDGVAVQGATSYLTVEDVKDIAKHFFELGLKS